MKLKFGLAAVLLAASAIRLGTLAAPVDASAWSAPLWSVISGGGGRSSDANVNVDGVIGQPIVGRSTGANYAVDGGFLWAFEQTFYYVSQMPLRVTGQ